jgi:hypothetical protein
MNLEENDNEIIDVVTLRSYKPDGSGIAYFNAELYSKLKHLEGKKLIIRYRKDTNEICIKPLKYE